MSELIYNALLLHTGISALGIAMGKSSNAA